MVKPPRIRHSKTQREPVTIDLDSAEVKRDASIVPESPSDSASRAGAASTFSGAESLLEDARKEALGSAAPDASDAKSLEDTASAASEPAREAADESSASNSTPPFGRGTDTSQPAATRPATAPRAVEPGKKEQRRGGVSAIAAGIVGGIVALAGGGALQYAGVLPSPGGGTGTAGFTELKAEIAALEQKMTAGGNDGVASAEAVVAANHRIDSLSGLLDGMKVDIASMQSAISGGGAGDTPGLQALDARVKQLEGSVAALASGPDGSIQVIEEKVSALEAATKQATDAASAASGAASSAAEKVSALEANLKGLAQEIEAQANNPKIALAIAASGLKAAIDRGSPFMTELETYAAVAPDAPEIAALREMAASGVPTRAEIGAELNAAATRMIAAAQPVDANAGFFGRLLASLETAVKVRPVGEVEGQGVGPTVSRIDAAIRAGDYGKAIAEYDTLPEPVKAAGSDFIAKVRARQSADALVEKALSGALRA